MQGTVVGVLRGGKSKEHDVSVKTGAAIIANLPTDRYTVRDIFIDQEGVWHDRGREITPVAALQTIDVALLALHGEYGESGEVQRSLERLGIPYSGADALATFFASHKFLAKERARELGIKVARDRLIETVEDAAGGVREVVSTFMQPVVVKPVRWGSSVGISIVHGYKPVFDAVAALFEQGADGVLIEEYIRGREATAGVVENLRNERIYKLPPVEIIPPSKDFFSYDAKYSDATQEICPGHFSRKESDELMNIAAVMHEALGLRHYSRSDFIVAPQGIYFLETNSAVGVGLTPESLLPKSLAAVGVQFPDFLVHLVDLALTR